MKLFSVYALLFLLCISSYPNLTSTFATIYRCEDSAGITVLTDSPVQLDKCALLVEESTPTQRTFASPEPTAPPNQHQTTKQLEMEEGGEYPFINEATKESEEKQTDVVIVPVKSYGGSLLVTVQLNNTRPAQLILDTGATMTVLSNDVALDLGLIANTNTQLTTVNTAGGQIQVNVTKLSSIQAGTAQVNNVDVAIHDLPDGPAG
ncbi:MAG: retropepsin-like aspartic protease family protein, partial [Nitrospirales bacterium]